MSMLVFCIYVFDHLSTYGRVLLFKPPNMQCPEVQAAFVEAVAAAEADMASFLLILEEGWTGDAKSNLNALEKAVKELGAAKGRLERIADELSI